MLETTRQLIAGLSLERMSIFERMATAAYVSQLEENLIPRLDAVRIATEQREVQSKEWKRGLTAAIASLAALETLGFQIEKRP